MLAPHIKNKVDKLWDRFWSAGITNPLVAVEQITYLLFLKRLQSIDEKRQARGLRSIYAGHEECKWSYIRQQKSDVKHLVEVVFPWLRKLETLISNENSTESGLADVGSRMGDAYFQLDPNKGQVLSDAIDLIDQLFARAGEGSAAQDVMGDTFEYLLGEIATAGKNGQFRTPRHLIRFMVELIDLEPGQRIIDPAAGTGGFLFSAQQYLLRKFTPDGNLRIEWDGAPHRLDGTEATDTQDAAIHNGALFVGLDNDRTMVRIGWMNLVLHGLENPCIFQADSLSKREGKQMLAKLAAQEAYDVVFANPPFKGTVDANDIDGDPLRFPRGRKKDSRGKNLPLTDKSELLFCWLMLDLLEIGGRCAVIVPEGVLFNRSDAHIRLRRELLTEHEVEAVISLPVGVFRPYTGVKTSILVFRKQTKRELKAAFKGQAPLTQQVWFYDVAQDGYSLDTKRREQPMGQNDLWDALKKFRSWSERESYDTAKYYQPHMNRERWRLVQFLDSEDKRTPLAEAFPDNAEVAAWNNKVAAIHELFPELPSEPEAATALIQEKSGRDLRELFLRLLAEPTKLIWEQLNAPIDMNESPHFEAWRKTIKKPLESFTRSSREAWKYFEPEDSPALPLWKATVADVIREGLEYFSQLLSEAPSSPFPSFPALEDIDKTVLSIAREFAKLDGFDVTLRSAGVTPQEQTLREAKTWVVPVRLFAPNEEWKSAEGAMIGSHDETGNPRPEYVQFAETQLYSNDGILNDGLLGPNCIEATGWDLSAGQYRPIDLARLRSDKNISELIEALRNTEMQIVQGLDRLKAMVGGRE
jgi:type I restriction enzyme M protein